MVPLPLIVIVVLVILVTTLKQKKEDFNKNQLYCGDTVYQSWPVAKEYCQCGSGSDWNGHVCCQINQYPSPVLGTSTSNYPSDQGDCGGLSCRDAENILKEVNSMKGCPNQKWSPYP